MKMRLRAIISLQLNKVIGKSPRQFKSVNAYAVADL